VYFYHFLALFQLLSALLVAIWRYNFFLKIGEPELRAYVPLLPEISVVNTYLHPIFIMQSHLCVFEKLADCWAQWDQKWQKVS
jgi:hypothetical protein